MTTAAATIGPVRTDALLVAVAIATVSTSGPLMAATVVPALAIAFWRNALATGVLAPYALVRHRAELTGIFRSEGRTERRTAGMAGLFLALHFATWVPSLGYTSVASATALVATQPVWAALLARAQGQHVSGRVWAGIGIALAGVLLLTASDLSVSGRALIGDALALIGGAFAALYMTAGSRVRQSVSTSTYTTLCYGVAAGLLLAVCVIGRVDLGGYAAIDWWRLVALTVGAQLLGHSLFNVVLRTVSPTVLSLTLLLEIPGAALVAWVFLGQSVPLLALPAAVLLLTGIAVVIQAGRRVPVSLPVE